MIHDILNHLLSLLIFFLVYVVPIDIILHALIRLRIKDDN